MFSLFWFQNKNEPPESVGEVNSPSSDESSEFEEVWPEIETLHEPLYFNDEDVVNEEDLEQTSALEEIQVISDNETDFVLVEKIKTEKEDEERLLNSELRGYEEESSSCEEMVRIIKSENQEIISKSSRDQREYRIFPDKEANFILGIDNNDEVLDENLSLNSESRELKEEESILGNEPVNNVISSEKATTPANGSIGQLPEVASEVLSYHNTCTKEEFESLKDKTIPDNLPEVDKFSFNSLELKGKMVPHLLYMFNDLFGVRNFDKDCLIRFFLTVRKNYSAVPYHNWKHGFCVAHSMYVIIKESPCVFNHLEKLALFIGALCHDMDYRVTTNQFPLESDSPLVDLYSTDSYPECHFSMIVQLLQEEGHNIFGKLKSSDYKKVLDNLKHCILATDLKRFYKNKKIIEELIDEESFDMEDLEHRLLLQELTMTACDISASAKPWKIHVEYVNEVMEEFYKQGDEEKREGKTPKPMMDRDKPEEQVPSQIEFISGFCIPCYELFEKLIPASVPLLQESKKNLEQYKLMKKTLGKDELNGVGVVN